MVKVFVSYSWADHAKVQPFVEQLRRPGLEVWMDQSSGKSDSFMRDLRQALEAADAFVVFWSENYPMGSWAPRELDVITVIAIQSGKRLYCVTLDTTKRSPFLMSQRGFELSEAEATAEALLGPDIRPAGARASSSPVGPPSRPLLDPSTPDLVIVGLAQEILERLATAPRDVSGPISLRVDVPGGSVELRLTSGAAKNRALLDELGLCLEIFGTTARECNATEREIADSLDPRTRTILEGRLPPYQEKLRKRAGRIREILGLIVMEPRQGLGGFLLVAAGVVVLTLVGVICFLAIKMSGQHPSDPVEGLRSTEELTSTPVWDCAAKAEWDSICLSIHRTIGHGAWDSAFREVVNSEDTASLAGRWTEWFCLFNSFKDHVPQEQYKWAEGHLKPKAYP
ncbi:MAG: toll/interleukin-1 receptor domain-containing protein [Planctomycetes bacterium]|nr:toll/interleukin-1 receptor domain-containing protein [Planctomycetota bacterium]